MKAEISLTERQLEILALVASGYTIEQSSRKVHLAQQSAYNILSLARNRTGANTVPHLVAIAITNGLIEADGEGGYTPAVNLS